MKVVGRRFSAWWGYGPEVWALSPFIGWRCDGESHSLRVALTVGPFYVGCGVRLSWCRHERT